MTDRRKLMSGSSGKVYRKDGELVDIVVTNEKNGKTALMVDTQSIESTYVEEISGDYSENGDGPKDLITPSSGNKIIIKDVFMQIDANKGKMNLDFDDGEKIARLYSSQFHRVSFTNMTIPGNKDAKVQFTGDVGSDNLFVVINYIEVAGD